MAKYNGQKFPEPGQLTTQGKPAKVSSSGKRKRAPVKYKPEFCNKLIKHMSLGLSFESFAGEIGVSIPTIEAWATPTRDDMFHPEFLEAKEIAIAKSLLNWDKKGVKGLRERNFDSSHWKFNMSVRFRKYWGKKAEEYDDPEDKLKNGNMPELIKALLSGPVIRQEE